MPAMSSRFSRTLRCSATAVCCGETLMRSLILAPSVSTDLPSTYESPLVGRVNPVSIDIVVVLPAPFTPSSAKKLPCSTTRFSSSTALVPPYRFVRCTVRIASMTRSFLCRHRPLRRRPFRFQLSLERPVDVGCRASDEVAVPFEVPRNDHRRKTMHVDPQLHMERVRPLI